MLKLINDNALKYNDDGPKISVDDDDVLPHEDLMSLDCD